MPDAAWQEPGPLEAPSHSPREHVRELEATSREFEAARAARAESFRRSIETQETHSAVLSASSELASLFQTTVCKPTSRASMSPQPEPQSCHGVSVLQSPVTVIVESTRFTFKKDGAPVNICHLCGGPVRIGESAGLSSVFPVIVVSESAAVRSDVPGA